jgi:hypothetical protein
LRKAFLFYLKIGKNMSYVKKSAVLLDAALVAILLGALFINLNQKEKLENRTELFYVTNQIKLEFSYVLIASSESEFEKNLTEAIANNFYSKPILFSIIDYAELANMNEDSWDNIIIITSAENNILVSDVSDFINNQKNPEKSSIIISTNNKKWEGSVRDGVDVITNISNTKNINKIIEEIARKIDPNNAYEQLMNNSFAKLSIQPEVYSQTN